MQWIHLICLFMVYQTLWDCPALFLPRVPPPPGTVSKFNKAHFLIQHQQSLGGTSYLYGWPTRSHSEPCLDLVKLVIAKAEFENMERLGIIRPSSSPWSSPLHIVAKQGGGWRPCGDYLQLNDSTTPDRYLVPHIQDVSARQAGKVIFS